MKLKLKIIFVWWINCKRMLGKVGRVREVWKTGRITIE